jgi:hypothetical protein
MFPGLRRDPMIVAGSRLRSGPTVPPNLRPAADQECGATVQLIAFSRSELRANVPTERAVDRRHATTSLHGGVLGCRHRGLLPPPR